ncbi:MAG: sulfite exporter TauE/SafE family protein [Actinomycetota bacterium]|nr:sulfite exporter TauE/SafE family protein [Actinomycetota bacterium]
MSLHLVQILFLVGAAVLAGIVNSVAGGGSLISFPALLAVGLPPVVANVTNSVASWPGYLGGTVGYRSMLGHQRSRIVHTGIAAIFGALAGTAVLLLSPASVFKAVVPFLVLGSCALLAFRDHVAALFARLRRKEGSEVGLIVAIGIAAVYGSYFGAGLGIIVLALLSIFAEGTLQEHNAVKVALSLVIATAGDIVFVIFAHVAYLAVLAMAGGFLVGGLVGAKVARRMPAGLLRTLVIAYGTLIGLVLLYQNLRAG